MKLCKWCEKQPAKNSICGGYCSQKCRYEDPEGDYHLMMGFLRSDSKKEVKFLRQLPPEERTSYREKGNKVPLHPDEPPMQWKLKIGDLEINALSPSIYQPVK